MVYPVTDIVSSLITVHTTETATPTWTLTRFQTVTISSLNQRSVSSATCK